MTGWQTYSFLVLVQVSVITLAAAGLMAILRRRAIHRHVIGLIAIAFVFISPILVGVMPRVDWFSRVVEDSAPGEAAATSALPSHNLQNRSEQRSDAPVFSEMPVADTPARPPGVSRDTLNTEALPSSTLLAPKPELTKEWQPTASADVPSFKPSDNTMAATPEKSWFATIVRFVWSVCVGIWIVGTIAFFIRLLWRERSIRRVRHTLRSISQSEPLGAAARAACERIGLASAPPIFTSDVLPAPVVLGVWRPAVVLPVDVARSASSDRMADILTHEFAHIVRRDPGIHVLQKLVGVAYWFHPGVRWLNAEITRSREEVCDNYVLRQSEPADYAQTLLDLSMRKHEPTPALSLLGLFRRESLEARVRDILRPGRELSLTPDWKIVVVAIAFLLAACVLIGGTQASEGAPAEAAKPVAEESSPPENQFPAEQIAEATAGSEGERRTITIRGICYDADKQPLAGVHVRLFRGSPPLEPAVGPPDQVAEVITGEDGRYQFTNIKTMADHESAYGMTDLAVVATKSEHASVIRQIYLKMSLDVKELDFTLTDQVGTLSGTIRDQYGRPISGATVFVGGMNGQPLPGIRSATSDEEGRYAITDLSEWNSEDTESIDAKTGIGTQTTTCFFWVIHPDYPKTTASYSAIPEEVDVVLHPPAIVEGQVIDLVTGKPLPNVTVSAQGIVHHGGDQTRTDQDGRYQLRLTEDHYNIWAEADNRMPLAVKALEAVPGERVRADIRMARGGFVTGRLISGKSGKPVKPTEGGTIRIGHYGPARPRTGAAVTSTTVGEGGHYRLHVAPGRNYLYVMSPLTGTSAWVTVGEGEEVQLDLHTGDKASGPFPDIELARQLRQAAREEDVWRKAQGEPEEEILSKSQGEPDRTPPDNPPKATRRDTPTGRLLDRLEELNTNDTARFDEAWAETMRDLIRGGSQAVPELIQELDRTESDMMVSCLAFILRGIDDKRAVPALIRAIPKTLAPGRSDMGLWVEDPNLLKFMQRYDLEPKNRPEHYGFGRSVREVFGALHSLTGQRFNEQQLVYIHRKKTAHQIQLQKELFHRTARRWSDWWEANWSEFVDDSTYSQVNLPTLESEHVDVKTPIGMETNVKPVDRMSGATLESVHAKGARNVFYDLDTGRTAPLPKRWRDAELDDQQIKKVLAWAAEEGFDLVGDECIDADGKHMHAIRPIGLKAWELLEYGNQGIDSVRLGDLREEGRPAGEWLLHTDAESGTIDPQATTTFLFITREGSPGLIDIGVDVQNDSQKPGGVSHEDPNLDPVGLRKGRRFGTALLVPVGRD